MDATMHYLLNCRLWWRQAQVARRVQCRACFALIASPMQCRSQCGACCTAPSISSPIPGMPHGKPAGVPCVQLMDDMRCAIFGQPERPACCGGLQPSLEMCGSDRAAAMHFLTRLEQLTAP